MEGLTHSFPEYQEVSPNFLYDIAKTYLFLLQ